MSSATLDIVATFLPKPGKSGELIDLLSSVAEKVKEQEPGTLIYSILEAKSLDGIDQVVVIERYTGQDTLDFHMAQPSYKEVVGKFDGLCEQRPTASIGTVRGGFMKPEAVS
ncbi:hypothetical protein AYO21_01376 [Fonsecaea monophora]|uniref:ABM domain-containing protein n=1 Tax=Fonsecaea monophora TaxID=254056 RepID=A0A177FLB8_9EURO|nr:hypothetical protein AYO21_01376 [Fonsecaea monophora]OAG44380.1 hypothetical protein AYO21_01376 [Fonsecaea monophora]